MGDADKIEFDKFHCYGHELQFRVDVYDFGFNHIPLR